MLNLSLKTGVQSYQLLPKENTLCAEGRPLYEQWRLAVTELKLTFEGVR